jgi:hypothetical protein
MNFNITTVPIWLAILFIIAFVVPIFAIAKVVEQSALHANYTASKASSIYKNVIGVLLGFYLYVSVTSILGIFSIDSFPPKAFLFTAVPLLLFYFGYFFRSNLYKQLLLGSKLSALVRIHIFRFVGIFFIVVWNFNALPKYFALVAGLGDIFAAITAIYVAKLIDQKNKHYKKITLVWNIIGFWDIVNVLITALVLVKQGIDSGNQTMTEMVKFPFALIPAFAPATIIFLHIIIFKKLRLEGKE